MEVCASIGLNWLAALKLHESGWLSFDPKLAARLDPAQETELRFLGSLVSAGCDENLLKVLLSGLKKPYSYRAEMIYYDWTVRGWSILPTRLELREMFLKWLDDLAESAQIRMLEDLRDNVNSAIREIRGSVWW